MKRFVYAAAAIAITGVLVLLAMAIAQRDARVSDISTIENELPYANQPAQPISGNSLDRIGNEFPDTQNWPPAPLVRGNDSPLPLPHPSTHALLTSYSDEGSPPTELNDNRGNIRKSNSPGRLAEPPPYNALNTFLSPSLKPSGPSTLANPNANLSNTLPVMPNSRPSLSPGYANTLPVVTSNPAYSEPSTVTSSELPLPHLPSYPSSPSTHSTPTALATPPTIATPTALASPTKNDLPPVATLGMPTQSNSPISQSQPSLPSSSPPFSSPPFSSPPFSSPTVDSPSSISADSPVSPKLVGFSSAAPGVRQLEGSQNPSMEIQKRAPNEVQVGIPATFTVLVRNVGNATAFDVNVVDAVPKGARLLRTSPQAQQNGPTGLSWKLGEMTAGAEQMITIELVPESEGEIGSVASVNFAAQASVRTISTQPKLLVKQLLEPLVLGGDSVKIMIDVSNTGTGTARSVRLEEDVPQNMRHASGAKVLELSVGDLAPGESQKFSIELTAVTAGKVTNILRAIAENSVAEESSSPIEVISPKLQIGLEGPKLRYLERQATYTASITNTGTAMATNVDLIVYLPSGLQFNSAENRGEYIPNQHAVMWQLAELAAGQTAATKVTLLPVEEGDCVLRMQATADSIRAEAVEKPVRVEGQSELAFSIEDDNDPIEIDGKTTYVVKIVNTGTRVDNDVQLLIDLPDGASVVQVDAPVNYQVTPRAVQFSPISQMKSKDQQTIRIVVQHSREGTHVLRAQLKSKLRPGAVIKEESTQVYRDQ